MADNNYEIDVTLEETFGTGVRSVEQTATSAESGGMNEITVTLTNDQENKFYIMNGLAGKDGRDGGFPVAVGEASLMTDTSKIYLYVGIEEGYTQNHLYYWDGEAWHDYGTYGAPADYLRSASVTHEQGLDQLGNTTYTADTLTLEGNADGVPAETEFVQKLYYSAGENVDGALTQKATSEAIEAAQYLPIVNHPNAPVGDTALSVELQQNVMNVIGGVGYAFTTITMTLATKKAGRVNRYFGRFTTGGNAIAVTWPTGVTVPSALSYKTQTTYDFVIEDSILHVWEDGNAVGDVLDATATANAVSTWLTNHPEATTTVADGSITTAKLASGVIDQTLTVQGAAADSAKVGQELSDLKSEITQLEAIPWAVKQAMDTLFQNVIFKNTNVYTDELATFHAWASAINLLSISTVFNQGQHVIYTDDSLEYLKRYLTVTANYDDGTSGTVSDYTLSGELTEGTSVVTVAYGGKSASINVSVTASPLVYSLLNHSSNGTSSTIVDTNLLINDTDQDFTILIDVTTSEAQLTSESWRIVDSIRNVDNHQRGISIVDYDANYAGFRWCDETVQVPDFNRSYIGNVKFAIRHSNGSGETTMKVKAGNNTANEYTVTATFYPSERTLKFCGNHAGTNHFKGIVSAYVYEAVLDNDRVNAFLGVS